MADKTGVGRLLAKLLPPHIFHTLLLLLDHVTHVA